MKHKDFERRNRCVLQEGRRTINYDREILTSSYGLLIDDIYELAATLDWKNCEILVISCRSLKLTFQVQYIFCHGRLLNLFERRLSKSSCYEKLQIIFIWDL